METLETKEVYSTPKATWIYMERSKKKEKSKILSTQISDNLN